jgi:hypothetical protein
MSKNRRRVMLSYDYSEQMTDNWAVNEWSKQVAERFAENVGGEVTRRTDFYLEKRIEVVASACAVAASWIGLGRERDAVILPAALAGCMEVEKAIGASGFRLERLTGERLLRELGEVE